MNEQYNDATVPDTSEEEMKLPENARPQAQPATESTAPLNGIIIVILIFLLIFILGGLYVWFSQLTLQDNDSDLPAPAVERPTAEDNNEQESTTAEAVVEAQQAVSTSDEISAIEADLQATDLDNLDAELNAIDAELEAALGEL